MDILNVRQLLRQKSIYEIPLRVTFYARVISIMGSIGFLLCNKKVLVPASADTRTIKIPCYHLVLQYPHGHCLRAYQHTPAL